MLAIEVTGMYEHIDFICLFVCRWKAACAVELHRRFRNGYSHSRSKEERLMICKVGKSLAFAVVMLCVVSTLAVAMEMTCSKADDKGCTMAKDMSGKEMAIMAAGIKVGDKMDCEDQGACTGQATGAVALSGLAAIAVPNFINYAPTRPPAGDADDDPLGNPIDPLSH